MSVEMKIENQIATVTINRPESLNALSGQVLMELDDHITQLVAMNYDNVRCLVITGAGEKAFVAGADIKEIHSLKASEAYHFAELGQKVFRQIEELKVPTIAAVNGFALGGGLELALSCDFIYASEKAKLGLPEVSLGLIPGFGGTVRLTRVVGKARAKEMILSGLPISATEAQACGLVNRVFPADQLMSEVKKMADVLVTRGPLALEAAKRSVEEAEVKEIPVALENEAQKFASLFSHHDVFEGTLAFIEKRKPTFQGT
jgi:enoyl-CoA hydratase